MAKPYSKEWRSEVEDDFIGLMNGAGLKTTRDDRGNITTIITPEQMREALGDERYKRFRSR